MLSALENAYFNILGKFKCVFLLISKDIDLRNAEQLKMHHYKIMYQSQSYLLSHNIVIKYS